MALVTLNDSLAEVGGTIQHLMLQIEVDGLVVGHFGKLMWAGAALSIEPRPPSGCVLRMTAPSGGRSSFFVPAECLGGGTGIDPFVSWLEKGATHAGASVKVLVAAA